MQQKKKKKRVNEENLPEMHFAKLVETFEVASVKCTYLSYFTHNSNSFYFNN